jgi:uncharacterized protein
MNSSRMRRAIAVAGAAGAAVLLAAVPAFAHVSVQPGSAVKGSYGTVSFKVPNEENSASTIKVEVYLPINAPVASVATQPVPGWTVNITKSELKTPLKTGSGTLTEAVTKITWSGGKIRAGEFQQFPVSLGPLPDNADQMVFKAIQTYDNKDVVRWIETQQKGQAEPQHPAPTLALTSAAAPTSPAVDKAPASATSAIIASTNQTDDAARILGIVGIIVGAAGVAFGVLAGRRRDPSA